jgi:hypothetical protein
MQNRPLGGMVIGKVAIKIVAFGCTVRLVCARHCQPKSLIHRVETALKMSGSQLALALIEHIFCGNGDLPSVRYPLLLIRLLLAAGFYGFAP